MHCTFLCGTYFGPTIPIHAIKFLTFMNTRINMGIAYNHKTLIAHSTQTSYYNWLFNCYLYVKIAGLIFTLLNCFITLKLKFSLNTTFVDWVIFCFSKRSCNMSVFCPFITPFMESVYNILIAYLYNFSI